MSATISSINYCPVKSISFQSVQNCKIKKNIGIMGDRMFAFAKGLNQEEVKLFENSPDARKGKWNSILTLKNSAVLNKYNFVFNNDKLTLFLKNEKLLSIDVNQQTDHQEISNKILELEKSLKPPLALMKNEIFPFFDTSLSKKIGITNSISLLNIQSIIDIENKIDILTAKLPPLKNFVIPGGHVLISYAHLARCVCRRAERYVTELDEEVSISSTIVAYMNRLSDYFFTHYFS